MGPLVGCLALCHFDDSALVAQQAADGLIHLYRSAACCPGKTLVEEGELPGSVRTVWKDEARRTLWKAPRPSSRTGHLLQASSAGTLPLSAVVTLQLGSIGKGEGYLPATLGDPSERLPSADLWRTLVSFHYDAVGALNQLLTRLLGDPQEPPASEEEAFALGLAAAEVLAELLRKPPGVFSTTLHDRWSVAWIAVVLWVSRLHSHQASHGATARQPPQSSAPPRCGWPAIPHKVSWELLTDVETFLDGVSLLTRKGGGVGKDRAVGPTRLLLRAMQEWLFADHLKMASIVAAVLDGADRHHYPGTTLTVLVELLRHPSTHPLTDRVLAHLRRHLTSSDAVLHSLALNGLLHMAESPKKVLSSLQEADHPKAQRLLDHLHVWLQKETSPPVAAEVAGHMSVWAEKAFQGLPSRELDHWSLQRTETLCRPGLARPP
ncbi:UNVERIFIED_CONTAM: hypothetical protein K2H54_006724 [Gekko kuhli]